MQPITLAYRQAAVQGANGFGLLVAMYDALISDLRRAAQAQRDGNIEQRCKEANHALLVLGFMEGWIDRKNEGELAKQLLALYSRLRSALITAQVKQSAELLEQSIPELLLLRRKWEECEFTDSLTERDRHFGQPLPVSNAPAARRLVFSFSA